MKRRNNILSLVFLLLIFGCSKDEDEIPPTVIITSPTENGTFQVMENVIVKASIQDNEKLERVSIRFLSEETRNVVLPTKTIYPESKNYELDIPFELSDSLLKSGSYYFEVEAFDGTNEFSAFRTVKVSGIPKRKISLIVSCSDESASFVYEDDNRFNFNLLRTYNFNFLKSTFNSNNQQLWVLPKNEDEIQVVYLSDESRSSSISYMSQFNETFTSLKRDKEQTFVALKQGELYGFTPLLQTTYSYKTNNNRLIDAIAVGEENILVEETDVQGSNREVKLLFRSSGAIESAFNYANDVVDFVILSETRAFIFYNAAGGGGVAEVNPENVSYRDLSLSTNSILQVLPISNSEILIATSMGVEYLRLSDLNLYNYLPVAKAVLEYDSLNRILYVGDSNKLTSYEYTTKNLLANHTFTEEVKGITVRYNRN